MKDYQKHLDKYIDFPEYRPSAETYLEKYWLDKQELQETWLPIKQRIFTDNLKRFPDNLFNENFDLIINKGGVVLEEVVFLPLQSCMQALAEKFFIVLEDYDEENPPHTSGPPYRFKYPVDITWEMLMSDETICLDVYQMPVRNYYVFGDSGQWGKYAGNDYDPELDIIGFQKSLSDLFRAKIKVPEEDIEDLKEWTASYGMRYPDVD